MPQSPPLSTRSSPRSTRSRGAANAGLILVKAAAIAALGAGIGIADSYRRPLNLSVRPAESPPQGTGGGQARPVPPQPAPVAGEQPGEAPSVQPADATPVQAAPAPAPVAQAPGSKPFVPSTKASLAGKHGHITLDEAIDFQFMGAVFLDARNADEFAAGRIPGAHLSPLSAFRSGNAPAVLMSIDKMHPIVVYCGGGDDCSASEDVALLLNGEGFFNVHILHDGYTGWAAVGHPVEMGGGQ